MSRFSTQPGMIGVPTGASQPAGLAGQAMRQQASQQAAVISQQAREQAMHQEREKEIAGRQVRDRAEDRKFMHRQHLDLMGIKKRESDREAAAEERLLEQSRAHTALAGRQATAAERAADETRQQREAAEGFQTKQLGFLQDAKDLQSAELRYTNYHRAAAAMNTSASSERLVAQQRFQERLFAESEHVNLLAKGIISSVEGAPYEGTGYGDIPPEGIDAYESRRQEILAWRREPRVWVVKKGKWVPGEEDMPPEDPAVIGEALAKLRRDCGVKTTAIRPFDEVYRGVAEDVASDPTWTPEDIFLSALERFHPGDSGVMGRFRSFVKSPGKDSRARNQELPFQVTDDKFFEVYALANKLAKTSKDPVVRQIAARVRASVLEYKNKAGVRPVPTYIAHVDGVWDEKRLLAASVDFVSRHMDGYAASDPKLRGKIKEWEQLGALYILTENPEEQARLGEKMRALQPVAYEAMQTKLASLKAATADKNVLHYLYGGAEPSTPRVDTPPRDVEGEARMPTRSPSGPPLSTPVSTLKTLPASMPTSMPTSEPTRPPTSAQAWLRKLFARVESEPSESTRVVDAMVETENRQAWWRELFAQEQRDAAYQRSKNPKLRPRKYDYEKSHDRRAAQKMIEYMQSIGRGR